MPSSNQISRSGYNVIISSSDYILMSGHIKTVTKISSTKRLSVCISNSTSIIISPTIKTRRPIFPPNISDNPIFEQFGPEIVRNRVLHPRKPHIRCRNGLLTRSPAPAKWPFGHLLAGIRKTSQLDRQSRQNVPNGPKCRVLGPETPVSTLAQDVFAP